MIQTTVSLKPLELSEVQARLDAIPGANNNVFEDNIWKFEDQHKRNINIDFTDLLGMSERYSDWPMAQTVNWVLLTKQIWLSNDTTSPNTYTKRLVGLKILWAAMGSYHLTQLNRDNCGKVLEFLLTIRRQLTWPHALLHYKSHY
jgi:hypothetical protein